MMRANDLHELGESPLSAGTYLQTAIDGLEGRWTEAEIESLRTQAAWIDTALSLRSHNLTRGDKADRDRSLGYFVDIQKPDAPLHPFLHPHKDEATRILHSYRAITAQGHVATFKAEQRKAMAPAPTADDFAKAAWWDKTGLIPTVNAIELDITPEEAFAITTPSRLDEAAPVDHYAPEILRDKANTVREIVANASVGQLRPYMVHTLSPMIRDVMDEIQRRKDAIHSRENVDTIFQLTSGHLDDHLTTLRGYLSQAMDRVFEPQLKPAQNDVWGDESLRAKTVETAQRVEKLRGPALQIYYDDVLRPQQRLVEQEIERRYTLAGKKDPEAFKAQNAALIAYGDSLMQTIARVNNALLPTLTDRVVAVLNKTPAEITRVTEETSGNALRKYLVHVLAPAHQQIKATIDQQWAANKGMSPDAFKARHADLIDDDTFLEQRVHFVMDKLAQEKAAAAQLVVPEPEADAAPSFRSRAGALLKSATNGVRGLLHTARQVVRDKFDAMSTPMKLATASGAGLAVAGALAAVVPPNETTTRHITAPQRVAATSDAAILATQFPTLAPAAAQPATVVAEESHAPKVLEATAKPRKATPDFTAKAAPVDYARPTVTVDGHSFTMDATTHEKVCATHPETWLCQKPA